MSSLISLLYIFKIARVLLVSALFCWYMNMSPAMEGIADNCYWARSISQWCTPMVLTPGLANISWVHLSLKMPTCIMIDLLKVSHIWNRWETDVSQILIATVTLKQYFAYQRHNCEYLAFAKIKSTWYKICIIMGECLKVVYISI